MAEDYDIIIRNGRIVDGTGNPDYRADVGITGSKIRRIAKKIDPTGARRQIDAKNRVVCPGFIDTHTHDDVYILKCPTCDDKVLQGVTTDVIGNCGQSPAPISAAHRQEITQFLHVLSDGRIGPQDLDITSFGDYLAMLEELKPGINVVPLVGHSTVRMCAMGMANRAPSAAELEAMQSYVSRCRGGGGLRVVDRTDLCPRKLRHHAGDRRACQDARPLRRDLRDPHAQRERRGDSRPSRRRSGSARKPAFRCTSPITRSPEKRIGAKARKPCG